MLLGQVHYHLLAAILPKLIRRIGENGQPRPNLSKPTRNNLNGKVGA